MVKYSVVVPVYNVKEYLDDCVNSVLSQGISDWELILVDDEATDGSGILCDRYAANDPRIHVIHQKNQGVAMARNAGLSKAQGDYVLFLDGDDWWAADLLQILSPAAEEGYDIIEFGFQKAYPDGITEEIYPRLPAKGICGTEYLWQTFDRQLMPIGSSCCSAYRRGFLLEHHLSFPLGIRYGEDLKFRLQVLEKADSVYGLRETPYRYRMRDSSVTRRLSPKSYKDLLTVTADISRNYRHPVTADYYCMNLLNVASLSRKEAKELKSLYRENRDLQKLASGRKAQIAVFLFSVFGWYTGAKLVRCAVSLLHGRNGRI